MPSFHEITSANAEQLCNLYFEASFEPIALGDAILYTARHRQIFGGYAKGFYIKKQDILDIFSQAGVEGLKLYLGIKNTSTGDELLAIALGTDQHSNDIGIPDRGTLNPTAAVTICVARPCPDECGKNNVLNG